jgi:hypothetical protein
MEKIRSVKNYSSEKSRVVSFLISGVIHEINNPNNLINLDADIFKKALDDIFFNLDEYCKIKKNLELCGVPYHEFKKNAYESIEGMKESSIRIGKITRSLKEFLSSEDADTSEPADINKAVNTAIVLIGSFIKRRTNDFSVSFGDKIPLAKMSLQKLEEVCVYLLLNASLELKSKNNSMKIEIYYSDNEICLEIRTKNDDSGCKHGNSSLDESSISAAIEIVNRNNGKISFTSGKQGEKISILKIPAVL